MASTHLEKECLDAKLLLPHKELMNGSSHIRYSLHDLRPVWHIDTSIDKEMAAKHTDYWTVLCPTNVNPPPITF
ncbi:MAG TPA: hypothetical protein PKD55_19025 [Bellilinea sp.]|nr:hypothetical protein [Bellilinea sp.]